MMPKPECGNIRGASETSHGRVLVVDDEALVCWSLGAGLRQAGFDTDTASSAAEALRLAQVRPHPDAMLLDMRLHDADPALLLRQIRGIAPDCRMMLMTTEDYDATRAPCAVVIVRKPFDLPDLVRRVGAEVTRSRTE